MSPKLSNAHEHEYQAVPSDSLRVKALELLLMEKGLVDPAALLDRKEAWRTLTGARPTASRRA